MPDENRNDPNACVFLTSINYVLMFHNPTYLFEIVQLLQREKRLTFKLLTCVLCNRQIFSKNSIFPNLIEQKTKKMHF